MFDIGGKIGGFVKDELSKLIGDIIDGWIEDFMNFILNLINDFIFNIPESAFASKVIYVLSGMVSTAALVVFTYKVVEHMIKTSSGTQTEPLSELFVRVGKSAGSLLILPWFLKWFLFDFSIPLSNYFIAQATDFDSDVGYVLVKAGITAAFSGISGIALIFVLIFFLVAFVMFLFSVAVFYADIILMQVFVAPVAISMIADDNNYFQVWWRELLSQVISMLTKLFLMTLLLSTLLNGGSILLAIGSGILIVKSPSLLKNMWYGGGGSKGTARGVGAIGSMSTRVVMSNLMR